MKIAICFDGVKSELEAIIRACDELDFKYKKIDLYSNNWLDELNEKFDFILIRPPCTYSERKSLFDERMFFIRDVLKLRVFPEYQALMCYENKRLMADFLKLSGLDFPDTYVSYSKSETEKFIEQAKFPLVFKTNTGSGASGVQIINTRKKAKNLIRSCFGIRPDLAIGKIFTGKKNGIPYPRFGASQKHYVVFQECLNIKWEWRIVKIGNTYFGHKKLLGDDGFASGSLQKGWELPPTELLDSVRRFCDKFSFSTISIDFFESQCGKYYANEVQVIFGHSTKNLMLHEGKPCRYIYSNNEYILEYGEFCQNESWNSRLILAAEKAI
ncbi:hypothetical protein C408_3066 [Vibrio diabolicus E0666]|uniref:ATP-grasp domain-containing protein n=1 Tax=Vibrio diabolicus TaxID=50719 RepID=UPI0002B702F8|nr:hypothetical protein [Vibrio diabolicus]EMD78536.1 hypothetical protein C408_3066 [Vibrio diabolicus E0666]